MEALSAASVALGIPPKWVVVPVEVAKVGHRSIQAICTTNNASFGLMRFLDVLSSALSPTPKED
jgi:hypothetical protein